MSISIDDNNNKNKKKLNESTMFNTVRMEENVLSICHLPQLAMLNLAFSTMLSRLKKNWIMISDNDLWY